jgi:hypothetical protein
VQRLHCSQLTHRRFFEDFALTRRPVIITGLQVTSEAWSLDLIEREAGALCVDVKAVAPDSCEWAGLELDRTTTVSQFIRSIKSGADDASSGKERGYLFDWSLPQVSARQLVVSSPRLPAHSLAFPALPCACVTAHHPPILRPRSAAEASRRLHVQGKVPALHL